MNAWLADYTIYQIIKALHVISVMAWMAGMLYLPRLFVYHADAEKGSEKSETFKVMERRLLRAIMNPAMCAVWLFGILMLIANPGLFSMGWMQVKLGCIVMMTVIHHIYGRWRKTFERDENQRSAKYYRMWNEIPTILMIVIVIMAIVEPF